MRPIVVVVVLAGVAALGYGAYLFRKCVRLRSWPSTDGRITRLQFFEEGVERNQPCYSAFVEYDYTVEGRQYRGTRLRIGGSGRMTADDIQTLVRPFAVGAQARVYYDPQSPRDSVLILEAASGEVIAWILMGCIALAVAFILALIPR